MHFKYIQTTIERLFFMKKSVVLKKKNSSSWKYFVSNDDAYKTFTFTQRSWPKEVSVCVCTCFIPIRSDVNDLAFFFHRAIQKHLLCCDLLMKSVFRTVKMLFKFINRV